ncbi:MAG: hypothetical protein A2X96_11075 [Syntrophobacterales bacterium GWC2_56_13]|nr:MAG: hypothetical protein A2X96_11075 [Syntrophobacterales bacterium GWC2_56_13]
MTESKKAWVTPEPNVLVRSKPEVAGHGEAKGLQAVQGQCTGYPKGVRGGCTRCGRCKHGAISPWVLDLGNP